MFRLRSFMYQLLLHDILNQLHIVPDWIYSQPFDVTVRGMRGNDSKLR